MRSTALSILHRQLRCQTEISCRHYGKICLAAGVRTVARSPKQRRFPRSSTHFTWRIRHTASQRASLLGMIAVTLDTQPQVILRTLIKEPYLFRTPKGCSILYTFPQINADLCVRVLGCLLVPTPHIFLKSRQGIQCIPYPATLRVMVAIAFQFFQPFRDCSACGLNSIWHHPSLDFQHCLKIFAYPFLFIFGHWQNLNNLIPRGTINFCSILTKARIDQGPRRDGFARMISCNFQVPRLP